MDKIKLIVTDLDGTLLTSEKKVSEHTVTAIKLAKEKGYLFGIATGRTIGAVRELVKLWGISEYVDMIIGMNGAQYEDFLDNYTELAAQLTRKDISEIYQQIPHDLAASVVYDEPTKMVSADIITENVIKIAKANNFSYQQIDINNLPKEEYGKLVICLNDGNQMEQLKPLLGRIDNERYHSVCTGFNLYEYMRRGVTKATGIEMACKHLNITLDQVLAFGDEDNDADMLAEVGIGVCMSNGSVLAKSKAKAITTSNDDNGIANYILEYML